MSSMQTLFMIVLLMILLCIIIDELVLHIAIKKITHDQRGLCYTLNTFPEISKIKYGKCNYYDIRKNEIILKKTKYHLLDDIVFLHEYGHAKLFTSISKDFKQSILLIKLTVVLSIIASLLLCVISFYIQDLQRYLLGSIACSLVFQILNTIVTLYLEHHANQFVRANLQNELNENKYIRIYIYAQEFNEVLYLCILFHLSLIAYFIII